MTTLHGECHCGAITFELEDTPKTGVACHCSSCQTICSSYSYNVQGKLANLKITKGKPTIFVDLKTGSGKKLDRNFCGTCGTALFSSPSSNPTVTFVKVGALKEAKEIKPVVEVFNGNALTGLALRDTAQVASFERLPAGPES